MQRKLFNSPENQHVSNLRESRYFLLPLWSIYIFTYIMLPEHHLYQRQVKCITFPKAWLYLKQATGRGQLHTHFIPPFMPIAVTTCNAWCLILRLDPGCVSVFCSLATYHLSMTYCSITLCVAPRSNPMVVSTFLLRHQPKARGQKTKTIMNRAALELILDMCNVSMLGSL
jgi:hypothetical protein